MKFLNISDTKLKVTLSAAECLEYGIDASAEDHTTPSVRAALREILALAEVECGFSVAGEKILVQLCPLPSGECELLVTKLTSLSRKYKESISSSGGVSVLENSRAVYRFDTAENLCSAVRALPRTEALVDLYRDDLGRYYLCLEETVSDGISEFEVFIEFGERLSALPIPVLSEYGECIAKDIPLLTVSEYTV